MPNSTESRTKNVENNNYARRLGARLVLTRPPPPPPPDGPNFVSSTIGRRDAVYTKKKKKGSYFDGRASPITIAARLREAAGYLVIPNEKRNERVRSRALARGRRRRLTTVLKSISVMKRRRIRNTRTHTRYRAIIIYITRALYAESADT